jgi:hypothetical protein
MPFVRVATAAKKKFLLKQLLILTPLSLSGIFLATQVISSMSSRSGNSNASAPTAQTAPTAQASQRSAAPAARRGTPLNGPTGDPGDPFGGGNPGGTNNGGGGGTGGGGGGPVGAVPVDGGLTLLLAAGLGYGARKAYQYHNAQKESQEM